MKYEATINTEYVIDISDINKFSEYYTTEEYRSVFYDFDGMADVVEHLLMSFDSMDGSLDKHKVKYYKYVEGIGTFYFDNRVGWSTNDIHFKECGFSIVISEKETDFDGLNPVVRV